jgi:hypothetical protein
MVQLTGTQRLHKALLILYLSCGYRCNSLCVCGKG